MSFSTKHIPSAITRRPTSARLRAGSERTRSESGQALVEFALVLPIMVVVLLGVALFGIALNDWIDETQLTSQAVRFAAVNNEHGTGNEIKEEAFLKWIKEQGDNGQITGAGTVATMCSPTSKFHDYVEVKLTYNYTWLGLAGLLGTQAETPLTSTARMQIEKAPVTPYKTCA
jgi:Flp pilus assembly protein TadG